MTFMSDSLRCVRSGAVEVRSSARLIGVAIALTVVSVCSLERVATAGPADVAFYYIGVGIDVSLSKTSSLNGASRWFTGSQSPSDGLIHDFNGDGKTDIAYVYAGVGIDVLVSNGGSGFTISRWLNNSANPTRRLVGDFTGDGKADVAYFYCGTGIDMVKSTGTAFTGAGRWFTNSSCPTSMLVGDFTGDGKADIAYYNAGVGIDVVRSTGSAFVSAGRWFTNSASPSSMLVGDFTGDRKDDIAYRYNGTGIDVVKSTGSAFVSAGRWHTSPANPTSMLAGDFNGDGKADLAYQYNGVGIDVVTSTGSSFGGNGSGRWLTSSATPHAVAAGDFGAIPIVPQSPSYPGGSPGYADYYIKNFPYSWTNGPARSVSVKRARISADPNPYNCPSVSCGKIGSMPVEGPNNITQSGFCGPALMGDVSTAHHYRPNIGAWKAIFFDLIAGTDTSGYQYGGCSGNGGDPCQFFNRGDNLLHADPIAGRAGVFGCSNPCPPGYPWYCCGGAAADNCGGSLSSYWTGPAFRRMYWGEITPNYYGIAPSPSTYYATDSEVVHSLARFLPGQRSVVSASGSLGTGIQQGDAIREVWQSLEVNGMNIYGGGGGPRCGIGERSGGCYTISSRAKGYQFPDGHWEVMITGYLTGDSLWQNTVDYYTSLNNMAGNYSSINATVIAVQNFLAVDQRWATATIIGHSLGAADATVLYDRGYGYQVIGLSPPYHMPYGAMMTRNGRPAYYYSGVYDIISNPWCGSTGLNQCRQAAGIPLWEVNTGNGFLTFNNPHDRRKYFDAIGWTYR